MKENKKSNAEIEKERIIVHKEIACPVCDKEYKQSVARKIKLMSVGSDIDFRNYYEPIEPLYYDVYLCEHCGYAADSIYFEDLKKLQKDRLKSALKYSYKPKEYPLIYTCSDAIERYRQAFFCADAKPSIISEKAYLSLKTAWLFREAEDKEKEKIFLLNAVSGFEKAYTDEEFPICKMDKTTFTYLIGAIHFLCENYAESSKWISSIITDIDDMEISAKLKELVLNLNDELKVKV